MKQTECFIFVSCKPRDSQIVSRLREQRRAVRGIGSFQRNCLMATLTTDMIILHWHLLSAVRCIWPAHSTSVLVGLIMSGLSDQQRSGRGFCLLVRNGVAWYHNGGYHRHLAQHRVGDDRRDESDTATMANDFDLIYRSLQNGGFFLRLADALIIHLKTI